MANIAISALPAVSSAAGTDAFPVVQGGVTKQETLAQMATYIKTVIPVSFGIAISDETTALTTGTAKATMRAPFAMTVTKIKASLTTVSSSGIPTFDVNKNGVSMFSTTLTIDANEKTSESAATPAVLATTAIAADDELTFDIDVAGTGAAGAKIYIIGNAT